MNTALKLAGAVLISTVALGVSHSQAGLLDSCEVYADESAKQQQENQLRSCNLKGDHWTTDLKKHIAWCKSVPPQKWKARLVERKKQLDGKKAQGECK